MKKQNKVKSAQQNFLFQAVCMLALVLLVLFFNSCEKDKVSENPISENPLPEEQVASGLLFSSDKNGHNELYRLQNDEETLLLSDSNYDYWWPKVSPDKSKILVYRSAANPAKNHDNYQEAELLLVDIEGKNEQVIIEKGKHGWTGQGVSRWNKDGTKILMISEQIVPTGKQWRMVTTDAQGNNPKNLSDWWIIDPNFSIDNSQVVFMAFPDNALSFDLAELELHRANYDETSGSISDIIRLTTNFTRDHDPAFSPNGKQIVFSAGNVAYTNVDIALYDTESNEESKLVDDSGSNGGSMCWSLDGKEVYFHSLNLTQHPFQIKKVNINSDEVTTLLASTPQNFGYYHPEAY
ncbi:TolB family protein [Maribacter sp. 2308TA10-17]|uniref:TolB family protein n=1 Tax=Maribacter sp. 2308TA10-17 TaxID=3386276 RepID=UPI0039BD0660